jgi:hypothetical protein
VVVVLDALGADHVRAEVSLKEERAWDQQEKLEGHSRACSKIEMQQEN